eukprot:218819_1
MAQCQNGHIVKYGPTGYAGRYRCNGCSKSINEKNAYRCASCKYDLCQTCYDVVSSTTSSSSVKCSKGHNVKFGTTGYAGGYRCNVCTKSYKQKYAHRCSACQYDLCENCHDVISSNTAESLTTCLQGHNLKYSPTGYSGGYRCNGCCKSYKQKYAYRCSLCKYDLCNNCHTILQTEEKVEVEYKTKENDSSTTKGSILANSGIGQLTAMLEQHLQIMKAKDATVDKIISKVQTADSLRDAKKKALENETTLLLSIMEDIGEMNTFLQNIILIENLFNSLYQPSKQKQEEARAKYAKNISKYENKAKCQSKAASFVELIFAGQTHVSSFQTWLEKVVKQCNIQKVKIVENSGAKIKKIQRAFYKAFYVYSQQDGFKEMTDILRCSLVFDDFENLYKCFSIMELMADETCGGLLRVKDRFHPSTIPFGYRDLLINIYCPGSKIVVEIQLHFIEFYKYKKVSHKMYKLARLFERDTGNLAYEYSTKFMRPKIGTFKVYEVSKDEIDNYDDDNKNETRVADLKYDELLKSWGLEKYAPTMLKEGWDDPVWWKDLTDDDLKNDMNFSKGHIRKFRGKYQEWLKQIEKQKK